MDAPVEELGAPAEPLGPSGAPDYGAPFIPVPTQRAGNVLVGRTRHSERDARCNSNHTH
jgi:hypothetical protein